MKIPVDVYKEYQNCVSFNSNIGLYETVKQNENFYVGNQWEGVIAPDLDKPIFNLMKRVVGYLNAMLVSDDIAVSMTAYGDADGNADADMEVIKQEISRIMENNSMYIQNRDAVRNASVDGDACFHVYFDPNIKTNNNVGEIVIELVDNTNVLFGNENCVDVQKQPFIILSSRRMLDSVKEEARQNGIKQDQIDLIQEDSDEEGNNGETYSMGGKVTVLTKYWKEKGTVHFSKSTHNVFIKEATNTELKMYPVSYMTWEKIKNCYHGQAVITGMIPNQIFINKLFAMAMKYQMEMAFPKIVYDKTRIPEWSNKIGAIGVFGDVNSAITKNLPPAEMSNQVLLLIEKTIEYTRDFLGASDTALGTVNPENTSAIIAVQKATAIPLQLPRMAYYQFVEDYIRILVDVMSVYYGVRKAFVQEADSPMTTITDYDFSTIQKYDMKLKVDIGAGAYFDELTQMQTVDNLYKNGIIKDAVTYLNSIPDKYLKNKAAIIKQAKAEQLQMAQMAQTQGLPQGEPSSLPQI